MATRDARIGADAWELASEIAAQAECLPAAGRTRFVCDACDGDDALAALVRTLLSDDDGFLDHVDVDLGVTRLTRDGSELAPAVGPEAWSRRRIDDRYDLGEPIARGGSSVVFRAHDTLLDEDVAVKILSHAGAATRPSARREVAMLRHLRLPGVVQLRADGTLDGHAYLVLDLADGERFPGTTVPAPWETVGGVFAELVRVVARVHNAGVVHRDLKPGNVLVDAAGHVTILDTGLAALDRGGGATAGFSDGFAPPEQLAGAPPQPSADLYALGALLVHVLVGRAPGPRGPGALLAAVTGGLARTRVPELPCDVPDAIVAIVARLLSDNPGERPGSAAVLDVLAAVGVTRTRQRELPWLGPRDAVDALVAAALAGRSLHIHGPPGCGRSRTLREAGGVLADAGIATLATRPGNAPYESLGPPFDTASAADVPHRLGRLLADGLVVIADDHPTDAQTRVLLDTWRTCGAVLSASTTPLPGSVAVPRVTARELERLFEGPERLFHLQSDAAFELHRRTDGLAGRVERHVADWISARICHEEDGRLRIASTALEQLREEDVLPRPARRARPVAPETARVLAAIGVCGRTASPLVLADALGDDETALEDALDALECAGQIERDTDGGLVAAARPAQALDPATTRRCHAAAAGALAPGTPGRLAHLVAAAGADACAEEARRAACAAIERGTPARALALALEGLRHADGRTPAARADLLRVALEAALHLGDPSSVELALREIEAGEGRTPAVASLEALARGALAAMGARPGRLALRAAPPFADPALESWRLAIVVRAAETSAADALSDALAQAESFADAAGIEGLGAIVDEWRGWAAYEREDYDLAIRHHRRSADTARSVEGRAAGLAAAAAAAVELGRFDDARRWATLARDRADQVRNVPRVAQAEVTLRLVEFRSGRAHTPDLELIAALQVLGLPQLLGLGALTEAVVAFHAHRLALARELASLAVDAAERAGETLTEVLARAVVVAASPTATTEEIAAVLTAARACGCSRTEFQVRALLATRDSVRAAGGARATRATADGTRREVFSVDEAWRRLLEGTAPRAQRAGGQRRAGGCERHESAPGAGHPTPVAPANVPPAQAGNGISSARPRRAPWRI